ncbi:MAG: hypothetical protein KIG95_03890 [Comamonas sp.]|nr:hypothetical protein [Comamonas sp.]
MQTTDSIEYLTALLGAEAVEKLRDALGGRTVYIPQKQHRNKGPYFRIRARLVERGSSYRQWALANGYQPRTVAQAVSRWAGKDTLPRGRLTYRVLRELSEYIGMEVTKGVLA